MSNPVLGAESLAYGALAADVGLVTGYPGSPVTGVFDSIVAAAEPGRNLDASWAPNEKVAMEMAIGASIGGQRALVILKSVGLNIALDPLATATYSGCPRGLVILLGDDPGAWGSQNEQDSRWLARTAEVPVVEPTGTDQAAAIMAQAFAWSESAGSPIIVRVTRCLTNLRGPSLEPWHLPPVKVGFYRKRNRWLVLPHLAVRKHASLHRRLRKVRSMFEASPYDEFAGEGAIGILGVGGAYSKLRQVFPRPFEGLRTARLSSVWPLPEKRLSAWLRGLGQVLVLEEGDTFVEEALRTLVQGRRMHVAIHGRLTGDVPTEGALALRDVSSAVSTLSPRLAPADLDEPVRSMPSQEPLCEDCLYRPAFQALLDAMDRNGGRKRYIVVGETSCMVRANLPPMELFDIKYSLGSALGLGLGVAASAPKHRVIALLGDSSLYHSDMNAIPCAVQRNPPLVALVLDNGTTALTGGQVHPGSAQDRHGRPRAHIAPEDLIRGCGIEPVICSAEHPETLSTAIEQALQSSAFRMIVVRARCPRYTTG